MNRKMVELKATAEPGDYFLWVCHDMQNLTHYRAAKVILLMSINGCLNTLLIKFLALSSVFKTCRNIK